MNAYKNILASACLLAMTLTHAQVESSEPSRAPQTGVDRMKSIMDGMQKGSYDGLKPETQRAVKSGIASGEKAATLEMPAKTLDFSLNANEQWQQLSKEAYVAALPPRDRPIGASILLGDGTLPGHEGRLYFFVSRSMPMSLLKAYAIDALYTGATLVTKGVRKGDTIKEYIDEAIGDFNSVDGQLLGGMEINPNLFDMFGVDTVPAVVWTNRVGLEDVGAGCQKLPEGVPLPQLEVMGPDDRPILVDKPVCARASSTSYYKLAGALTLPYVLERFEEAGLAKEATKPLWQALAERRGNTAQAEVAQVGNAMPGIEGELRIDRMPRFVLEYWKDQLATSKVQRSSFGPAFSDEDDDPVYRAELEQKVRHGLGS